MAELVLEIVEGKDAGRQLPLSDSVEVGRESGLQLSVDDEQVSRHHARLRASGGVALVEDLGSTNGTYVNDQPIHGVRELQPGDRIRFGVTVLELRTSQQVAAQPSAVRPIPDLTVLGRGVLQPVAADQLPASRPASPGVPSFLVEETEPAFVPPQVVGDADAESGYKALAALVDSRVKRQTNIAFFAFLSLAGLAVLIFFGVR